MKAALKMLLGLAVMLVLMVGVQAEEKKEKTLKGEITCAKCGLKLDGQTTCHTVIKVKGDDDKEVVYWFDKSSKDYKKHHTAICQEAKKGKVTGTISEKDDKKWIKVSKVEFDEKE